MTYLDNAASTPVLPEVLESMLPYMQEHHGNPSSIHRHGRIAKKAIRSARADIARLLGADPSEILLTSGGTESDNTAILGAARAGAGRHIITTVMEHEAVLGPCAFLESQGYDITRLPADGRGNVLLDSLPDEIRPDTCLFSMMLANNEVGTIQPVAEAARICSERGVPVHCDAIQAAGKMGLDVKSLGADMLSVSSHKINGPKGVGALYIRKGTAVDPLLLGGGQEGGMRSGTENVAGIAGFGTACRVAARDLDHNISHMRALRDRLSGEILESVSHCTLNGEPERRLPNNAHFTFLGTNGEDMIIKLDEYGIAASTGSACSINTQKASHVLEAMGFNHEEITGSLRLSVGVQNTSEEIDDAVTALVKTVGDLRAVSPFKSKYGF